MSRFDGKIAVFICGPVRYVSQVAKRLEQVLAGYEYDCFYHIWKTDLGNKVRGQEETDITELAADPRTKVFIRQQPYSPDDFRDTIGLQTGSNSSINATMGMFFSVNVLCHYLALMPDSGKYKYILRLRTDCAIISDNFAELLDPSPDVLTVSDSCFIPPDLISDHIAFGAREIFARLWQFGDMGEIYRTYEAGSRNPEKALAVHLAKSIVGVRVNPAIVRFKDYHIVYYPPRDCEPEWVVRALNAVGVAGFFEAPSGHYDPIETDAFIAKYNDRWRSERLLGELPAALGSLDDLLSRVSIDDIAGMLIRVFHNDPDTAQRLLGDISPGLSLEATGRMLRECRRSAGLWASGSAWLAAALDRRMRAGQLFLSGCQRLRDGASMEAAALLEEASGLGHPLPNLNFALATALSKLGRYGSASHACQQELKLQPGHKGTLDLLARLEAVVRTGC
jgi:hypothetical protein